MPGPNVSSSAPNSSGVSAQAVSTSLRNVQGPEPWRSNRCFSSSHADLSDPSTVRGRKAQNDSPSRALAGSSGVATRVWWPRLCSTKKWP